MKKPIAAILFFVFALLSAQPDTEVYTFIIKSGDGKLKLTDPRNISNNPGYDNQPSFYDNNTVLFSSTREGQTDILKFNIQDGSTTSWLTDTPTGSEYSPLRIPDSNTISAVRLDLDGLQRLYEYSPTDGSSEEIIKGAKVGYYVWYGSDMLVATILTENRMDLITYSIADTFPRTEKKNVGRSLQNIPNTKLVSYISKENKDDFQLMSLNPVTGETKKIVSLGNTEDICWLPDGSILAGKGKTIYRFNPSTNTEWSIVQEFTDKNINKITRIAVNEDASRLAIVAETSPENIVQKQVEAFNSRNLEEFAACYAENVLVSNFPVDTLYTGNSKLKENYKNFYAKTEKVKVTVVKRISIGDTVIDEELATIGDKTHQQVAVYQIQNGLIASMNFIHKNTLYIDAETIVQKQLDAYNTRDIEAFLNTYTADVEVYNYPNEVRFKGIKKMREGYTGFFESTPDLHCEIKNRIVIGNKVIDEEYITSNGNNFSAVAIYEVKNGKIAKVTFVR